VSEDAEGDVLRITLTLYRIILSVRNQKLDHVHISDPSEIGYAENRRPLTRSQLTASDLLWSLDMNKDQKYYRLKGDDRDRIYR
jgi:hypothetical protein